MRSSVDYNGDTRTFDCRPTMSDRQVLGFCKDGYLVLEGVVPDEINEQACAYLDGNIPSSPSAIPPGMTLADLEAMQTSPEPSGILLEDWFVHHVLLNTPLAGILRSLLGSNVGLPVLASHHRVECPEQPQRWHHDDDRVFGPELNFVEVFYFPQDTPAGLGPTEVLPGTHIGPTERNIEEQGVLIAGPAGTIGIHHHSILHRRPVSTSTGVRRMLKYNYWRTTPPRRDWITQDDFDFRNATYGRHQQSIFVAHMFYWLCGKGDEFRVVGGQGWPFRVPRQIGPSYGFDAKEGYVPDWRRSGPDTYAYPDRTHNDS